MHKIFNIQLSLFICCLMFSLTQAQEDATVTLNGIVEEHEYDSSGIPISVVFNVLDEDFNYDTYIVVNDSMGTQLLDMIGENIDVTGTVKIDKDGTKHLTILEFFINEDEDYSPPDVDEPDDNDE